MACTEPKPEEQEREFSSPAPFSDDALVEKMENVALKSEENHESVGNGDDHNDNGGLECSGVLPLRPYAGDCPHYVRSGACKFGATCRFNHPAKKTQQLIIKGMESESENSGTIECKYFSTAGGCKYGTSCRYNHPGEQSENTVAELNFLGLPMRLGEKECEYYMRNGSCAYGPRCVYHHPDPTSMAGKGSPKSMDDKFGRRVVRISENSNGGSQHISGASQPYQAPWSRHGPLSENSNGGSQHISGASQPYQAPWSRHGPLSENSNGGSQHISGASQPYQAPWSRHGPLSENRSSPQWMGKQPEWNGYQTSSYSHQTRSSYLAPIVNGSVRKADVPVEVDEYPERPGQLECDYFMKTGSCKFKYACRFHHPKNRIPKPDEFVLSGDGLPLRPGRSICRHFERLGICKFGSACMFDHPVNHGVSTYSDWPASKTRDAGGWED